MAANPKQLQIVAARSDGASTRVLEVECVEGGAFDVVGGKYVIVHTGLVIAEKAIKRAYSLMPVPSKPGHAQIAVKRLSGPGSRALHEAPLGTSLAFSGPWGKLIPETGLGERTLLVATDTGITSALGIVEQQALAGSIAALAVIWLREPGEPFLDVAAVRARIERAGARFSAHEIEPITGVERASAASLIASAAADFEATHVIATGDGAIVYPLRSTLSERVSCVSDVRIECFFNNPEKKSA